MTGKTQAPKNSYILFNYTMGASAIVFGLDGVQ